MHVWCKKCQAVAVIINPRCDHIRELVVKPGSANMGKWLSYERDIRADFIRAFGDEAATLTGIALMTNANNTHSKSHR